jgi:ferrous iron transport protein A
MIENTSSFLPLSQSPQGKPARVTALSGDEDMNRRLRELGFYEGAMVTVKSRMPFGGPLVVLVDQFALALRRVEADVVLLEFV